MSSLQLCDGDDCYKSENDVDYIYHIDFETKEYLKKHCEHWFNSSCDDVCQDCINEANMDYPNFFILDEYDNLSISKEYLENPEKLK